MRKSTAFPTLLISLSLVLLADEGSAGKGMIQSQFHPHAGAQGTEHNRQDDRGTEEYLLTNSRLPNLPIFNGYVGTHGTYRHFSIIEQTAMHIGEPKHGVWRVHDNGFIREYRKTGRIGLHSGVDANSANLTTEQKDI